MNSFRSLTDRPTIPDTDIAAVTDAIMKASDGSYYPNL
jgi:hypothetical protein